MFSIIQAAGWPIWPLLICSVVALALVFERFYSLADKRIVPKDLLDEAIKASRHQLPSEDSVKHLASHSLLGRVLASGLQQLRQQPQSSETELSESIEIAGRESRVYTEGDRIRLISWFDEGNTYWLSNSLLLTLTNNQMLGMARAARVFTPN